MHINCFCCGSATHSLLDNDCRSELRGAANLHEHCSLNSILNNLDNILSTVSNLTTASHAKQASMQDIVSNVNKIKNDIIMHLFNNENCNMSPSQNTQERQKVETNKLIIPLPQKPPTLNNNEEMEFNRKAIREVEAKVDKVLTDTNTFATVIKKIN